VPPAGGVLIRAPPSRAAPLPPRRCAYVDRPNFGILHVEWEQGLVSLQVRDGGTGEVASGQDGSRQELRFSLSDCQLVQ
jgi:alkaline phosphatase D